MKKLLLFGLSAALFISAAVSTSAQVQYGVIGSASFPVSKIKELKANKINGWTAGLTLKIGLPVGFSLQPSLMYSHSKTKLFALDADGHTMPDPADATKKLMNNFKQGSVVLPISLQWGPDLLIFRPFVDVSPFIGYTLSDDTIGKLSDTWKDKNRFCYGLSAGVGFELWRIQVVARYNWNLGTFAEKVNVKQAFKKVNKNNMNGITVSAAILFGNGKKK